MKEETIERTRAVGSNKEAAITEVKRDRGRPSNPRRKNKEERIEGDHQTHEERTKKREQRERRENRGRPSDPRRENKEERIEGEKKEQRETIIPQQTIRPHRTHDYQTTIVEPESSLDQNHRWITSIGREKREGREEREERTEKREKVMRIKNFFFFFFYNSGYNELVLIQAHYSNMPKILPFESFDGVGFLVF